MNASHEPDYGRPSPEAIAEAKANPGGWVYVLDGRYDRDGAVPPEAVIGAWKVDDDGNITGGFLSNPNFVPGHPKREGWSYGDS